MVSQNVLTLQVVAARLRVPERTVRDWAKKGILKGRKLGIKKWVFDCGEVARSEHRLVRPELNGVA